MPFMRAGDRTQGFMHARQIFYQPSHTRSGILERLTVYTVCVVHHLRRPTSTRCASISLQWTQRQPHALYGDILLSVKKFFRVFWTLKQTTKTNKRNKNTVHRGGVLSGKVCPPLLIGPEVSDLCSHCKSIQWLERLNRSLLHSRLQFVPAQHTLFNHCERFN